MPSTATVDAPLHVRRTNALARVLVEDAQTSGGLKNLLTLRNNVGGSQVRLEKDFTDPAGVDV